MEHTTKMTLVPTEEANIQHLSELDSELSNILKNKELTQDDKIKLYLNVLGKYKKFEEKVYPEEQFQSNEQVIELKRRQRLDQNKVSIKKQVGKPLLVYTGSDNPIKKVIKKRKPIKNKSEIQSLKSDLKQFKWSKL